MSFWDKFGKVSAVVGEVAAVGGAIGLGVSSCVKNNFKRKMQQQEMDLKSKQQLLDQEIKLRELELKQRELDTNYDKDIRLSELKNQRDMSINQMNMQKDMAINQMNTQRDMAINHMNMQKDMTINQTNAQKDMSINQMNTQRDMTINQTNAQKDMAINQMNTQRDCDIQGMQTQQAIHTTAFNSQADVAKAQAMYAPDSALAKNNGLFQDYNEGIVVDNRNVVYNHATHSAYVTPQPYNMPIMNMGTHNQQLSNNNQSIEQIQKRILDAKRLLDQGLITEEEFANIKKDILDSSF